MLAVIDANSAAAAMTGYTKAELTGRLITDVIPQRYRDGHVQGMRRYLETGRSRMPSRRGVSFAIPRAVIALGKSMDLEVVAEGVETERQRRFLRLEGCHIAQGFLYSRPLPPEQFEASVQPRVARQGNAD